MVLSRVPNLAGIYSPGTPASTLLGNAKLGRYGVDRLLGLWEMRRGFSIFLILFFGLGPLSAFVDGSEDASLPACCRRHGAHHCAMAMQMAVMARIADPQPSFTAPLTCPYYPGPSMTILMPAHALAAKATGLQAEPLSTPAPVAEQAEVYFATSRAHAGRGPPAANLG